MKFIIDAQLPKKLTSLFEKAGYDTLHTFDLPNQNFTKDCQINQISIEEKRVVVSKDLDFIESLLISNKPYKLLAVSTGNITNKKLFELFEKNLQQIVLLLKENRLVELTNRDIIIH